MALFARTTGVKAGLYFLALIVCLSGGKAAAKDWAIAGSIITSGQVISDGVLSISDQKIAAIAPSSSISASVPAIKVDGIILPGFIDLHNHLSWNNLPRWIPNRTFREPI
jgi:5-methylthioadenosine/S-adenosylhomocysteine deaminase